jgi:hypothetical protein
MGLVANLPDNLPTLVKKRILHQLIWAFAIFSKASVQQVTHLANDGAHPLLRAYQLDGNWQGSGAVSILSGLPLHPHVAAPSSDQ